MSGKPVTLQIKALLREDDPLYFREHVGHADGTDGSRFDIDLLVSGHALLVTVKPPNGGKRRVYEIMSKEILFGVVALENEIEAAAKKEDTDEEPTRNSP
jgi:hypothetical protein